MTYINYTTNKKTFKHLNYEQRKLIERWLEEKYTKVKIAELLGVSRSTIYEEINRGTVIQLNSDLSEYKKYFADAGQRVYEEHRANSRKPYKLAEVTEFIEYAEEEILTNKKAPDTICGRAKIENKFSKTVCTKTLYNYIDMGLLRVKNIDLPLRVKLNKKSRVVRKNRRILGESIEKRPEKVNNREEFGHWEIDTVIGTKTKGSVLLTLDERLTRKRFIVKIAGKTTEAVKEGLLSIYSSFGDNATKIFKSITSDNGSEFAKLSTTLPSSTSIYYAHPYSSGERGTNEKQNSLIRYFYPKGRSFNDVSETLIARVEDWINNLPRKFAKYLTSNELFEAELVDLGIIA
jgi:IS30 family transposase